jgi:enamine deaminase RidA (YjgF/YER057c/UK114 family)
MRKTVLAPGVGELADGSEPASSIGQAVHRADGMAVTLSGLVHPEGDVEEQTRGIVSTIREIVCDDLGGELMDVTHLRIFVRGEALDAESRAAIHRVRRQAFEWPHYPSATTIGVSELVHEDALVEIETEAFVPDDGWEAEVLEPVSEGEDEGD